MSFGDESRPSSDHHAVVQLQARNRSHPNGAQLISSLPTELLVQVLGNVQILGNVYVPLHREVINYDTNLTIPYQLVCRRWRDVICSTPQFWQYISVSSSPEWLEFCLTRCAGALATVYIWYPSSPRMTFATLCRHASAIRGCYVHIHDTTSFPGLTSFLVTPKPALETLSLTGLYRQRRGEEINVSITHDLVPRLTTLDLCNCTPSWDTAVYTSLRSLTLSGSQCTISSDDFLDIMSKCRDLEYLSLDEEILDQFAEELADRMPTPVVLPRLKILKLDGQCETLFHVLAIIHAPQATKIDLKIFDGDEPGPLVTRLLTPDPQLRYPFLCSPRTVSVGGWRGEPFEVSLRCGPDSNALLSINYRMVQNEIWLERNLLAIMDLFSIASVDTLEAKGLDLDQIAVETWQRVFETYSNLRTLNIKGKGTLDTLWLGLSRASASSLEHDGAVCCPFLSEITIDSRHRFAYGPFGELSTTPGFFQFVRTALRTRADAGASRLKMLRLYLNCKYTDKVRSQPSGVRDAILWDVKELVEELDYSSWMSES